MGRPAYYFVCLYHHRVSQLTAKSNAPLDASSSIRQTSAGEDDLKGGSDGGADIVLSGAGNDKLDGGKGPDLLIGGTGADKIKGESKGKKNDPGDILISGWTTHDSDPEALRAILHNLWILRWHAGDDYDEIVDDLEAGLLLPGVHVFDDGVKDRLHGGHKIRDLFFADQDGDDGDDDKLKGDKSDRVIEIDP
jgi:hypothetical protein